MKLAVQLALIAFEMSAIAAYAAPSYQGVDLYTLQIPLSFGNQGPGGVAAITSGGQVAGLVIDGPSASLRVDGLLWNNFESLPKHLLPANPNWAFHAAVYATDGTGQVGVLAPSDDFISNQHAVLWSGTANSALDLHPAHLSGFTASVAFGLGGDMQVGAGGGPATGGASHAMTWLGSASSAADLHPQSLPGIVETIAYNTDGVHQVGAAYTSSGSSRRIQDAILAGNLDVNRNVLNTAHAILWNGTAASAVDLHPTNLSGFAWSVAYDVAGNQQTGSGKGLALDAPSHALLWTGTADSAVDLHPTNLANAFSSIAYSTNGVYQVGLAEFGAGAETPRAILWSGAPDSAVDLHSLLPPEFLSSRAYSIDSQGRVFGLAYGPGGLHAVMWAPVPEPPTLSFLRGEFHCTLRLPTETRFSS